MQRQMGALGRRDLIKYSAALFAAAATSAFPLDLLAQQLATLDVASAGSFRPVTEGPLKAAASQSLHLDLHSHAQGADAVARSLVDGSLHADIFVPITAGPMLTVQRAGLAATAYPIARTEMVLVYSPKSRFAPQFEAAAAGKADLWELLEQPGIHFAHGNPAGDPGGRNAYFVLMLAAKKYRHPDLVEKLLGSPKNPAPTGVNGQQMLHSGELDAATSYRTGTSFSDLPYIVLPKDVNLSGDIVAADHPDVSLSIGGKLFRPEPLVFYAAALKNAANPAGAAAFLEWLKSDQTQSVLRRYQFDAPGSASLLSA